MATTETKPAAPAAKPEVAKTPAKKTDAREYVVLGLAKNGGDSDITRIPGTFQALTDTAALNAMLVANPDLDKEGTYVAIAARHYTPRTGEIETTTKGLDTITRHRWT
ncbi:MAG: hypothetical protein WKF96_24755 [Solirubrobacteraceae bacterium]